MKVRHAILVGVLHACVADAAVRPASIFTDHMVLQRDAAIPICGTATPGATVSVTFGDQQPTGVAQPDGTWTVVLEPMPASAQPRDLILADGRGEPTVITDVVVGDVWLGSGQSNMAWSMKQVLETRDFKPEVVERLRGEIATADHPLFRFFNGTWKVCSPESVPTASAVGFYFSLEVMRDQKVPVGFIQAAIGGSRIEPWLTETAFAECEAIKDELPTWQTMENAGERVGFCYERVIERWTRFPIKGILWYQGESNVAKGDTPVRYAAKLQLLIESWRAAWGRADLPFYWVQLSPTAYTRGKNPDRLPAFLDAQRRLLALPRTGMAMTADVDDGVAGDLHPRNKWDVGRRLWRWAAWDTYGHKDVVPSGPLYKHLTVEGNEAVVSFDHVGAGLVSRDDAPLTGFELCGDDGIYHPATAEIRGVDVVVRSPEVARPVAVRYNWHETAKRSLFNRDGLPASPFSTEAWLEKGVAPAAVKPLTINLSGTDWRIRDDAPGIGVQDRLFAADPTSAGWISATVPGNIQADLEAARLLKPNSYGAGDPRLAEVARKDWWYRKDVAVPAAWAGKRLTLVFDGVDQECEVWLNGQSLGSNTGMFRRFWFDATSAAKPGQANQLAVRIAKRSPAPQDRLPLQSRTNLGYDWGTHVTPMGIWKDVRLEATGPARIEWTRAQTTLSDDHDEATVIASLDIESNADLSAKAVFRITGQGQAATVTVDAPLKKGHNLVRGELKLERPALWWPAGHGAQPLYALSAELQPAAGGEPLDIRSTRFGVRDIRWVHTEGAPENHVSRYQLIVNGRPIRTLGSNFVPADLFFGRMTPRAEFLFRQAHAAGMNTIRLWGGGVILHESLYDLADELGLLLVQEFPLANFVPPTDDAYLAMLDATARNIVRQVRNHPSIMEFDGGNEMRWRSDTPQPHVDVMRKVVAEEDGRMFRATCPDVGATHGPWECHRKWYRALNEMNTDAVVGGKPQILRPTMRTGEFGSHSPASIEIWHREFPPEVRWPIIGLENEILHRKRAVRAIGPYNWLYKNIVEDVYGPAESLEEFIAAGQFFGADGLRYMLDSMRRGGRRIGGMYSWMLNEPWPNGAGSYLVDCDGRPKLMYDFYKQALAPIGISLKYDLPFYTVDKGLDVELFLVSDASQPAENLRWRLLARDRRGVVFAERDGTASIAPLEVQSLGGMQLRPPEKTIFGPIFVELRLEDAAGKPLTERMHVFGCDDVATPLARLLRTDAADPDDDLRQLTTRAQRPTNDRNLMLHMQAKGMTPAPKFRIPWGFETRNITDGEYGSDQGWSDGWFEVKLRRKAMLGSFRFGRERTGVVQDRCIDFMKIETSLDGQAWQTVFERDGLTQLPGFSPAKTVEIWIPPVEAEHLRVTLLPPGADGKGPYPALDEFEAYAAEPGESADGPMVRVLDRPELWRPMRRTTLEVTVSPMRVENGQEAVDLTVKNTGPMTAFPCEVHPLISYRTDLFIDNNHCFVPPGESRTITIRADENPACGLTLAQTGWRVSCWNAADAIIAPSSEVLLSVGRRDAMCREFAGSFDPAPPTDATPATLSGTLPDPSRLPNCLEGGAIARFEFPAGDTAARHGARLRIHAADQSRDIRPAVAVTVNGRSIEQSLPEGLGIQKTEPAHLAYPATVEFALSAGLLRSGTNVVDVRLTNTGWFTWDAVDCVEQR